MEYYASKVKAKLLGTDDEIILSIRDNDAVHEESVVDNLDTEESGSDKVLSAHQGYVLKSLCKNEYANIEDMRKNFTKDVGVCYVINDDSEYCQGYKGNYYEYVDEFEFGEEHLVNGGCARLIIPEFKPIQGKTGDEILPTLLKIACSYCGVGVPYAHSSGPWASGSSYHNGIQCSQFVNTMIYGLPYERSKLANESNNNLCLYGGTNVIKRGTEYLHLSANQMAHYAACHGWLKKTNIMSEAEIGDVIFFYNGNKSLDYYLLDWKAIGHVAIVVGKAGNSIMLAQAGGIFQVSGFTPTIFRPGDSTDSVNFWFNQTADKPFRVGSDSDRGMFGFARFPLYYNELKPSEEIAVSDFTGSYVAGQSNITKYMTNTTPAHSFKYGVLKFNGYTALKDSNVGMLSSTQTVGSTYGDSMITLWNTGTNEVGGGVMPVLCKSDGPSKTVRSVISIRCSGSTSADSYSIDNISYKVYK